MTSTEWVPLSRRRQGLGPEAPIEGTPKYLAEELRKWARSELACDDRFHGELSLRLRTPAPVTGTVGEQLLDVVDGILYWHPWRACEDDGDDGEQFTAEQEARWQEEVTAWKATAGRVQGILDASGSAWRVNRTLDGLERRLDDTVTAAAELTIATSEDDAADHLGMAWRAAYGRQPDPDKAYDEAVLAVEAVTCPMVSPNNPRPTLGTVIRDLRNQTAQWELGIGDATGSPASIDRLVHMLALLWEGQSRHAGSQNSRRQTQMEGESAVHLAATIVQWLNSGVVRRKADAAASLAAGQHEMP
ncbi:hypothetical protein AB0L86_23090 [Micromonospora musae]|uniref:hypothetical protein n=1 Tax=Micromonospora musae TaxID=1894970 RepID=UPI00341D7C53